MNLLPEVRAEDLNERYLQRRNLAVHEDARQVELHLKPDVDLRGASRSLDAVRTASNSKKKPATTSSPRDESRRRREGAAAPQDAENAHVHHEFAQHVVLEAQ